MHTLRRSSTRLMAMLIAMSLFMAAMPMAGAAPDHKQFTATIDPAEALAGTSTDFDVIVTNTSDHVRLGAVRITVPAEFELEGMSASGWNVSGNQVTAPLPSQGLEPGESLVVTVTARTALQDGDTDYEFAIEARQANHFNGAGNSLNYVGDPLEVTVTGSAVACDAGSCSTSFSEDTTNANVSANCKSDDCGVLVLDLDDDYCVGEENCAGKATFWNPPADASGWVKLRLEIPKSEVDGWKKPKLYIAKSVADEALECGKGSVPDCHYFVIRKHGKYIIKAWIEATDPRAFAS